MSDETRLGVEIDADVNGTAEAKQLADALATVNEALDSLIPTAKTLSRHLNSVEKGAAGVGKSVSTTTKQVQNLADAQKELNSIGVNTFKKGAAFSPNAIANERVEQKRLQESIEATNAARAQAIKLQEQEFQKAKRYATVPSAAGRRADYSLGIGNEELRVGASFGAIEKDITKNTQAMRDSLFTARFALHDISNGFAVAGAALIAFNALTVSTAAKYEQAFAQIRRTTGATVTEMEGIEDAFIGLAQSVPVAFDELAKIGTLAGQLNIPTAGLEDFVKTTAMFASTTDVTVDAAATAFGRLDTLLPDVQGNYNALGSAILNVGVNSVATESEIISTTNQIAAAGAQAGFTADQVIGLAASFASLGVAPESARGTTIRVLSEIRSAVLEGGDALTTFADLAGQSADDFKNSWNSNASAAFMSVLEGLNKEGAMAEVTLRGLGITAVRDIRALLALSQNVEVVGNNMAYAADGFGQGTQLAESFAITSETLASRLQVLGQSLEAMIATLGESGTGPLTDFVNMLNELVIAITDISKSPLAQWGFVAAGIFTALAGGAALLISAIARIGAGAVAFHTVRLELQNMAAASVAAAGGVQTLQSRAIGATLALTTMRGALIAIGTTTGIGVAITALTALGTVLGDELKSNVDKAKDAFGDFTGLAEALEKDTAAAAHGAEVYGTITAEVTKTSTATADWVGEVERATKGQVALSDATQVTQSSVEKLTYSIGENTQKVLANMLANNTSVQEAVKNYGYLQQQLATGPDAGKSLDLSEVFRTATYDADAARAMVDKYVNSLQNTYKTSFLAKDAQLELNKAIDLIDGSMQGATSAMDTARVVNDALGVSATDTTNDVDGESAAVDNLTDKLSEISSAVQAAFGSQNLLSQMSQDFYDLAYGIATGSATLNAFSQDGQANIANLQAAISSSIAAGETLGISATQSVAQLFAQLQKMGIDTASLLAAVAGSGLPGVDLGYVQNYVNGTTQMTAANTNLTATLDAIRSSATDAAASLGGGGGGGGGGGVADSAQEAAKEVRLLTDYASDLAGVMSRAFDLRFGGQQGLDKITSGWQAIADATKEANDAIRDSRIELQGLASDKNINEYFLKIANQYGDGLRADAITADLADINGKIADEQDKLAAAQGKANKTLSGNSKAAIDNRGTILDLVGAYEDQLEVLASSGLTTDELSAATERLRQDFIRQATQAGFSRTEIKKYATAFDDMKVAIGGVPRNITVSANVNPALTALAEFKAKAQEAGKAASKSISTGGGSGYKIPAPKIPKPAPVVVPVKLQLPGYDALMRMQQTIREITKDPHFRIGLGPGGQGGQTFSSGGYTGNTGVGNVAGVVHGQEYVINAQNTARLGIPFLNALNSGRTPTTNGSGISVVELSAYDRKLLAEAGNVQLSIGGDVVAKATNTSNLVSARRGTN